MVLDIIICIAALAGFYRGYKKGIVKSALSLVGIVLGIVVSLKFSHVAAVFLQSELGLNTKFLPLISFVLTFIAVVIALKLLATFIEKVLKTVSLNFINKIGGGLVWMLTVLMFFSTIFWFFNQVNIINLKQKSSSLTYDYVEPVAPFVIDGVVKLWPKTSGLFESIEEFLDQQAFAA